MTVRELSELKSQLDGKRQEASRIQGALEQLNERLKMEFGCSSLEEAERKLQALTQEATEKERVYQKAYEAFMAKYGGQL